MEYRRIFWAVEARDERLRILTSIAEHNISAALRLNLRFKKAVGRLQRFPSFGRPGYRDTRDLTIHKNYQVIYRIAEERIEVVAVHHARRLNAFANY